MTPAAVRRRLESISRRREAAASDLRLLQGSCSHPTPTYEDKGSTGNYDPSADAHWTDWRCPDCGLFWTTGQDYEEKRRRPGAVRARRD